MKKSFTAITATIFTLQGLCICLSGTAWALQQKYSDGRPEATLRMDAEDYGIVLRYGDGPDQCDVFGARDVWVFEAGGVYYMHYDAAGPKGWLSALAVSKDLVSWEKKGPILDFGKPGEDDSKSAAWATGITPSLSPHSKMTGSSMAFI